MKKVLSVIIAFIMMLSLGVSASAAVPETVEPCAIGIADVQNGGLSFFGTTGLAMVRVNNQSDEITSITATLTVHVLQGTRWVYVGSDSGSSDGSAFSLEVTFTYEEGERYRSMLEVTVVKNGVTQSDTDFKYSYM